MLDREGDSWRAKGGGAKGRAAWEELMKVADKNDPIVRVVQYKLGALPTVEG